MNAANIAIRTNAARSERRPAKAWMIGGVALLIVVAGTIAAMAAWGEQGLRGRYHGQDGTSGLEFRGSRVYVTTSLGTTFVAAYEVDGDRVIIKGAGGAQVYTKAGDTLDGGIGIRFVKETASD